jgi:hypothetical protein
MELLRIEGSRVDLLALRELPELHVVGASAIDRGDGSWLVSAYAPDEAAIERLRERRLVVHRLKGAEQVRSEWAAATAAPVGYLSSGALSERLQRLASGHPRSRERTPLARLADAPPSQWPRTAVPGSTVEAASVPLIQTSARCARSARAVAQRPGTERLAQLGCDPEPAEDGGHARSTVGAALAAGADGDHDHVRALVHVNARDGVARRTARLDLQPQRAAVRFQQPPRNLALGHGLHAAPGYGEQDEREGAPCGAPSDELDVVAQSHRVELNSDTAVSSKYGESMIVGPTIWSIRLLIPFR